MAVLLINLGSIYAGYSRISKEPKSYEEKLLKMVSGYPDLNRGPHGPKPCALPTAPYPVLYASINGSRENIKIGFSDVITIAENISQLLERCGQALGAGDKIVRDYSS